MMKNVSRLEFILIGLIGLIGFAFFSVVITHSDTGPEAGNSHTDPTYDLAQSEENHTIGADRVMTYDPSKTKAQSKGDIARKPITKLNCDAVCLKDLSEALTKNGKISSDMMTLILENPGGFAQYLKSMPDQISPLLTSLKSDEGNENYTRRAARAVFDALSDSEKQSLANALLIKDKPQHRLVGLELIANSVGTQPNSVKTLNRIIGHETNALVLTRAINLSATLPNETDLSETLSALSEIINHNPNDQFVGNALIAKVSLSQTAEPVYQDIVASLTSFSSQKNASALSALEFAMDKYHVEFEETGGWRNDATIRRAVLGLSENEDISEDTRFQALKLRALYFE